jgi:Ca-activated chloride channel homolog
MMWPHFHNPWWLLGLALLPYLTWDYVRRTQSRAASIRFPSLNVVKRIPKSWAYRARHTLFGLRIAALALLFVCMARPQFGEALEDVSTQGVDIMLALDVSSSMRTMDFKPKNRLVVAKQVIEDFILGRKHDRIGLVVFSGRSYTQCPLTIDYSVLVQLLRQVEIGRVEDGTAIGTGLLNGANRLRSSVAKSKVMVLLTDGENNSGEVDPVTAARAAAALGIKIYTIGVGKEGEQPIEVDDPFFGKRIVAVPTKIDEPMLRQIAGLTGGQYFRAQDPEGLKKIYENIDKLEKTEIKTTSYMRYRELFAPLALLALGFLVLEMLLAHTRFRKLP